MRFQNFYIFFGLQICWLLQTEARKKTDALFFSFFDSPSCPSSFRLFAGSETRQNERMWDSREMEARAPEECVVVCMYVWVKAPISACASSCCSHLSVMCVGACIDQCFSVQPCWYMLKDTEQIYLCASDCVFVSTTRHKTAFETWLHSFSPIPTHSFIWASMLTSLFLQGATLISGGKPLPNSL